MKRKDFLRNSLAALGAASVLPAFGCDDTNSNTEKGNCTVTPTETEGPFPTKSPSTLSTANIVSDRQGIPLTIKITIKNTANDCAILKDAIVDIWHCDAAGNYSEYGGTGMQATNYTSVHFLRGRQTTDANGIATFISIYPGWYSGRAPHIHVHVYNSSSKSLLITQIAFPESVSSGVYTQGVYAAKGQADTTNARDNVFSDGISQELATVTGSASAGYTLNHTIYVSA